MYEVLLRAQFHLSKSHAVNLDHFATGTTCRLAQVNVIFKRQRRDHCFLPINTALYTCKTDLTHQQNVFVGANISRDLDEIVTLPFAVQEYDRVNCSRNIDWHGFTQSHEINSENGTLIRSLSCSSAFLTN